MVTRRRRNGVETSDYLAMTARVLRGAGKRVGSSDAEDLTALIELRELVEAAIDQAVDGLRLSGTTWEEIGQACGTTRQGAIMRWKRRRGASASTVL